MAVVKEKQVINWPRSINQYSNMAPRLSGQTSVFGGVVFRDKRNFKSLRSCPGNLGVILEYWHIERGIFGTHRLMDV